MVLGVPVVGALHIIDLSRSEIDADKCIHTQTAYVRTFPNRIFKFHGAAAAADDDDVKAV
jgi:hypothetical protein